MASNCSKLCIPLKSTFNRGKLKFFKFGEKAKLFVLILSLSADAFKRALPKAFPKFLRQNIPEINKNRLKIEKYEFYEVNREFLLKNGEKSKS